MRNPTQEAEGKRAPGPRVSNNLRNSVNAALNKFRRQARRLWKRTSIRSRRIFRRLNIRAHHVRRGSLIAGGIATVLVFFLVGGVVRLLVRFCPLHPISRLSGRACYIEPANILSLNVI